MHKICAKIKLYTCEILHPRFNRNSDWRRHFVASLVWAGFYLFTQSAKIYLCGWKLLNSPVASVVLSWYWLSDLVIGQALLLPMKIFVSQRYFYLTACTNMKESGKTRQYSGKNFESASSKLRAKCLWSVSFLLCERVEHVVQNKPHKLV